MVFFCGAPPLRRKSEKKEDPSPTLIVKRDDLSSSLHLEGWRKVGSINRVGGKGGDC